MLEAYAHAQGDMRLNKKKAAPRLRYKLKLKAGGGKRNEKKDSRNRVDSRNNADIFTGGSNNVRV